MTLAKGFIGRYPIAIAAGLGLNGVVAFQLASRMSWPAAIGIVVIEGLVITALVLLGFRERVFDAVPLALKQAISVGIGLFIAFIGFVDAGFVRRIPDAFTFSITNGIGAGFVTFVVIKAFPGKAQEVHWLMWIVAALFVVSSPSTRSSSCSACRKGSAGQPSGYSFNT